MADLTADYDAFRGLVIPDPRWTLDTAQSTITQDGPLPGVPVAQQDSEGSMKSGGSQAASVQLRVRTLVAGMPGNMDDDWGIIWYHEGDALLRGWDPPTSISHWEAVTWTTAAGAVVPAYPHAITLSDETILQVYGAESTIATADTVVTRSRDPDPPYAWGAAVQVYDHGSYFSSYVQAHPCLLPLPGGHRTLCFHWVELGSGNVQVRMEYSDNGGASWTVGSTACLPEPIAYTAAGSGAANYDQFGRLRAVYHEGSILLVASLRLANTNVGAAEYRDTFRQYVSTSSLGTHFALVDEAAIGASEQDFFGAAHDLVVVDGRIVMAWASLGNSLFATCVRLSKATDKYTEQTIITINGVREPVDDAASAVSGREVVKADLTLTVSDSGDLFVFYPNNLTNWAWYTDRSQDGGATWETTKNTTAWWGTSDPSTTLSLAAATWCQGRAVLLHQWDANPGDEDPSVGAVYLGGWSTVTHPPLTEGYDSANRMGYFQTWLPFDIPSDMVIWVATTAGVYTEALTDGGLVLTTTVGTVLYEDNPTGTVAQGLEARVVLATTTSTTASDAVVAICRLADGAQEFLVHLRFGTTGIVVRDQHAGANVGTINVDVTDGIDFKIAMQGSVLKTWYRARSSDPDRKYIAGPSTDTLTDGGAVSANNLLQWGHAAGSTAESKWFEVAYSSGAVTGVGSTTLVFPDDLTPRHLPATLIQVDAGTRIIGQDGPALVGHEWDIDTRYRYEFDRCLPTKFPSPRIAWQATGETQQVITLKLDDELDDAALMGNVLIAVGFFNSNVRTGSFRGRAAGGAYSTLLTFDTAKSMADLDWDRVGSSMQPVAGGADAPYLYLGECSGWSLDLGGGVVRLIRWNAEGKWNTGAGKDARLFLEDADGTEGAAGTGAALVPLDTVFLLRPNDTPYRALQIILDAQTTATGKLRIGTLVVGYVVVHGEQYSWGRVINAEPFIERTIARDQTDRVRVAAPVGRTVQFAWTDGVDMTKSSGTAPTPDYIATSTATGARPAASMGDTPLQLEGSIRLLEGARKASIYLPRIPKGSNAADTATLNRRVDKVLMRVVSPVRIENIQGDESEDEVVRVASIVGEEIT